MAIVAIPILPATTVSSSQWKGTRLIEEATQTFKFGTPVAQAAGDGGIIAWAGAILTSAVGSICGISYENASNLASTGLGAPTPMSPFTGVGAVAGTFGFVPNQPSAKNIAHGAPFNDGRVGFFVPAQDSVFVATFGNAGNAATPLNTDVGLTYGLTLDTAGNFWYVDKSKTGASAAVRVVNLDPRDTPAAGTRVEFTFLPTVVTLVA
jgi:hypothetical protein